MPGLNSVEEIVFYKSMNIHGENQSAYWSQQPTLKNKNTAKSDLGLGYYSSLL